MDEISQLESDLELGNKLARLKKNRDFKDLFIKMYLEDGALMLTKNLKKLKYNKNANMDIIDDAFIARSDVYGFMEDIEENARNAGIAMQEYADEANEDAITVEEL